MESIEGLNIYFEKKIYFSLNLIDMKKIAVFTIFVFSIFILVNCSPKTQKAVSKTENSKGENNNTQASTPATPPSSNSENRNPNDVVKQAQGTKSDKEQVELLQQVSQARVDNGKALYETNCKKCHELHNPSSRSAEGWVNIMKKMGPKAQLEQGPYMMISSYLVKNAKK